VIKVSVFYPNGDGLTFDMDHYLKVHIPLVQERLQGAIRGASVDKGIAGGAPGAPAAYVAVANLLFDSIESFQAAFGPHAEEILGDIPNFTNGQPVIQLSEVAEL